MYSAVNYISNSNMRKDSKLINIDPETWNTINSPNGVLVLGSPGKGKSIIGETLDKLAESGWSDLNDEEQKIVLDVKQINPKFDWGQFGVPKGGNS